MKSASNKPRLMTPDLEAYIERVHFRTKAEAEEQTRISVALREAWASEGGRAFQRFIDTRPAAATRRIYRQHIVDFLLWVARFAGGVDPLDVTPEDLATYEHNINERVSRITGRRLSLRTRQERVRTVRTAYQFCVDEGLVDKSPARHLRIRGRAEPKRTFLSDEGAIALLAACEGERLSDVRDRTLITVLLHTGLRAAEAASMTWNSINDGSEPSITIEGKGRVVRTVPLSDAAYRSLGEWAERSRARRRSDDVIWTRVNHRIDGYASRVNQEGCWSLATNPLTPMSILSIVSRRASRAALEHVTPHTLRRTFATKLKRIGVSIDTISRYLGHASILTTVGYFDPYDEGASQVVRALRY